MTKHQSSKVELDYRVAEMRMEDVAAMWLEARASENMRAWREMSVKLDEALAEMTRVTVALEHAKLKR